MVLPVTVTDRFGQQYHLRALAAGDAARLAIYFEGLSAATRTRFGPHPLTAAYAFELCDEPDPAVARFVLLTANERAIVGYFIIDFGPAPHEALRYADQGITLETGLDPTFAPSIADAQQDSGLASAAMPYLIAAAQARGARSMVLMGGAQASNARAIAFYAKQGFVPCGGYWSDQYNHDMRLLLSTPVHDLACEPNHAPTAPTSLPSPRTIR